MKKIFFDNYQNILIIFPFFLIIGPFLTDLTVSISSLLFLIFFYEIKIDLNELKKIFIFIIFFWFLFILNSILSENILTSLKSSFFSIRFLFFSLLIFYFFSKNNFYVLQFNIVLKSIIIFLCIDALFQYIVGFNFFGFEKQPRLSGVFETEWILGSFLSKAFALTMTLSFYNEAENKEKKYLYLNIIVLILVYITVILTFERASFIFLNLYILLSLILIKKYRKYFLFILGFIFILNLIFLSNLDHYKNRYINNFLQQIDIKNKNYFLLKDYSDMFLTSYEIFKDQPLIGVGNKNFRNECKKYLKKYPNGCSTHPHNYYAQFMSENGLSGLIFVFLSFIYFSIVLFKNLFIKESYYKNFIITSSLSLLLIFQPLTTSGNFFNNWNLSLISLIFGFFLLKKKLN